MLNKEVTNVTLYTMVLQDGTEMYTVACKSPDEEMDWCADTLQLDKQKAEEEFRDMQQLFKTAIAERVTINGKA